VLVAKMHGAGNDFVVVASAPPASGSDSILVRQLADRHLGIGADGVLFLERLEDASATLRMHFYNCDGARAGLCLNGSRCAALRAVQLGWADEFVRIRTEYTEVEASVDVSAATARVQLRLPVPEGDARKLQLPDGSVEVSGWAIDIGDPHLVIETASVAESGFEDLARPLRWWTGPDAAGSNVHFVERAEPAWIIRSFERGIEGETLACGSGCVSTLLSLAGREDGAAAELQTRTGDRISVAVRDGELELVGSAVCVFTTDWTGDG